MFHVGLSLILTSLSFFNHGHWDHIIFCGFSTNLEFIFVIVVISHIILCGIVANMNFTFKLGLCYLMYILTNFDFIFTVAVINYIILRGIIINVGFNFWVGLLLTIFFWCGIMTNINLFWLWLCYFYVGL